MRRILTVQILALLVVTVGCGGGTAAAPGTVPTSSASPTLTSVAITPATLNCEAGQTAGLYITGHMSDGTTKNLYSADGVWSSSNLAVATTPLVTLTCSNCTPTPTVVTCLAIGTTDISATVGTLTDTKTLTVTECCTALAQVDVFTSDTHTTFANIAVGKTQQFYAEGFDTSGQVHQGSGLNFTWFSSDTTIATVLGNSGLVTGIKAGTATISVTVNGLTRTIVYNPATLNVTK
jgi:hypothetical protein